ncbi:hypothetical protein GRZ55_12515 [Chelativorans sp. ZYF759]|uniref:hypothetical protein n=1 Tax=Chelativorans sp. ZYF759 TaxID=2692213 RepID=UPI0016BB3E4F|nr:hypothetical protein [Chelativorans sp. ZYF759]NMG40065.1 hypothetical protein [Chelativorans sp. ZYF759]
MASKPNPNFSALLDALMSRDAEQSERVHAAAPSLRVDFLDQLERLQASSPGIFPGPNPADYPDLDQALDELEDVAARVGARKVPPTVDPRDIEAELGDLSALGEKELTRVRRDFALKNHPDRLPDDQRGLAELRMRAANVLIDEAKRKVGARRRG